MTVIVSFWLVPNSYSPGAMTPTEAGSVGLLKLIDLTWPSKYSLIFSTDELSGFDWEVI